MVFVYCCNHFRLSINTLKCNSVCSLCFARFGYVILSSSLNITSYLCSIRINKHSLSVSVSLSLSLTLSLFRSLRFSYTVMRNDLPKQLLDDFKLIFERNPRIALSVGGCGGEGGWSAGLRLGISRKLALGNLAFLVKFL